MSNTTDIHTLAGAFALDALTEIERASFARHLATCDSCALEAAELTETAARLAATVVQPAPHRLRASVLAEVARTHQVAADAPRRRRSGWAAVPRRWAVAAVAAGTIAVAGVATVWTVEQHRISEVQQQARTNQASLINVLAAGDAHVESSTLTGGGAMIVAASRKLDAGVVLISDLPAAPDGKAYQIWLVTGSSAKSLAVLPPRAGSAMADVTLLGAADHVAVTVEPAGGSPAPTSAPIGAVALA